MIEKSIHSNGTNLINEGVNRSLTFNQDATPSIAEVPQHHESGDYPGGAAPRQEDTPHVQPNMLTSITIQNSRSQNINPGVNQTEEPGATTQILQKI